MNNVDLKQRVYESLLELEGEDGINASGKDEVYGCFFGRDSAVTILKILKASKNKDSTEYFLSSKLFDMCKKGLLKMIELQGRATNIESGEEPGKFIHEYRKSNYERIIKLYGPRVIYPDSSMRNYDSIDATPLGLIAIYKYWEITGDAEFLLKSLPAVEKALNWIFTYGDRDRDYLLEYEFSSERTYEGSRVQSWTDSPESILQANGSMPPYPIAPVEVQGYAWLSLKLWAEFYGSSMSYGTTRGFSQKLALQAEAMKKRFNEWFLFEDENCIFPAQALDGLKNKIHTVTGNPLLLLWATYEKDGNFESIIEDVYISDLVNRSFKKDMFEEDAGIRTMSSYSPTFNPNQDSYHNGSFWPKLNGMAHEGVLKWGYEREAQLLHDATIKPIAYFGSPIELYVKSAEGYLEWRSSHSGHASCRNQAWSAAVAFDLLTL